MEAGKYFSHKTIFEIGWAVHEKGRSGRNVMKRSSFITWQVHKFKLNYQNKISNCDLDLNSGVDKIVLLRFQFSGKREKETKTVRVRDRQKHKDKKTEIHRL